MKFDFYYSEESEQYSFYSVPKMFFTLERFTGLSAMSKLLYGFLLDRMSLSRKRNWIDDKLILSSRNPYSSFDIADNPANLSHVKNILGTV